MFQKIRRRKNLSLTLSLLVASGKNILPQLDYLFFNFPIVKKIIDEIYTDVDEPRIYEQIPDGIPTDSVKTFYYNEISSEDFQKALSCIQPLRK